MWLCEGANLPSGSVSRHMRGSMLTEWRSAKVRYSIEKSRSASDWVRSLRGTSARLRTHSRRTGFDTYDLRLLVIALGHSAAHDQSEVNRIVAKINGVVESHEAGWQSPDT